MIKDLQTSNLLGVVQVQVEVKHHSVKLFPSTVSICWTYLHPDGFIPKLELHRQADSDPICPRTAKPTNLRICEIQNSSWLDSAAETDFISVFFTQVPGDSQFKQTAYAFLGMVGPEIPQPSTFQALLQTELITFRAIHHQLDRWLTLPRLTEIYLAYSFLPATARVLPQAFYIQEIHPILRLLTYSKSSNFQEHIYWNGRVTVSNKCLFPKGELHLDQQIDS
ncbi:hypothetical protein VNO77_19104 [Canavalia gladiata]|uniref:Uncharacterized protein n=1 Tax=Canavalia gladiata TaxID=3824 RepID=A0AAN9QPA9_CANGL